MLLTIDQTNREREHVALRSMFAARKRIFVDYLKWNLPVLAGRFEVDHFDDSRATYLIVTDTVGEHLASARLLSTTRPAPLDSHFPYLVAGPVPQGPGITEITRFCLSRDVSAHERTAARNLLLVGLVEHARRKGIGSYTGMAELAWFPQIQMFGWDCRQLGTPREQDGRSLVALQIHIDETTAEKLAAAGIRSEPRISSAASRAA